MNTILDVSEIRDVPDVTTGESPAEAPAQNLAAFLATRRFNIHTAPPEAAPRYLVGKIPISTSGNLTVISGGIKSAKSSFVGAMLAAAMAIHPEAVDCLGVRSDNKEGRAIIHLDTEQSLFDHYALIERAVRRAGLTEPPSWLESYCLTGATVPELWSCLRMLVEMAQERFHGVHSIFLDGVGDMVLDVNDPAECNLLVASLHSLAIKMDCPIITAIHFNPGGDKVRGHLGSQLERKAETNLRLDKEAETVVVWSEKNRRAPITKNNGPRFTWSDPEQMHVSMENLGTAKEEADRQNLRIDAVKVFDHLHKTEAAWGEFIDALQKVTELKSAGGARKRMEKMIGARVIVQKPLGGYALSTSTPERPARPF